MKLIFAIMFVAASSSAWADTFNVSTKCLSQITKANEAIGESYINSNSTEAATASIDKIGTSMSDDGMAIVNGKVKVEQDGDLLELQSVTTIFPVGDGCYIVNVSLK